MNQYLSLKTTGVRIFEFSNEIVKESGGFIFATEDFGVTIDQVIYE